MSRLSLAARPRHASTLFVLPSPDADMSITIRLLGVIVSACYQAY